MLTIQNVRKDIHWLDGYEFDGYKLVDGGLSGEGLDELSLQAPFYSFFWNLDGRPYIKVVIKRTPITDDPNHKELYGISYGIRFHKKNADGTEWIEIWKDIINQTDIKNSNKFYMKMIASIEWLKNRGLC
jgi:hypothetical protein